MPRTLITDRHLANPPRDSYQRETTTTRRAGTTQAARNPLMDALAPIPGEQAYYDNQISRASRSLAGAAQGQQHALYGALEARGLGQSSVLSQGLGDIGRLQSLGLQDAQANVSNQQFQASQARYMAALDFERQKELIKYQKDLNKKPWWQSALGIAGTGLGFLLGGPAGAAIGGAAASAAGKSWSPNEGEAYSRAFSETAPRFTY